MLIKQRNIVLQTINYIIFIFNSYLPIIGPSWYIHIFPLNCVHISRTIVYNKYPQKNGEISPPKVPAVAELFI